MISAIILSHNSERSLDTALLSVAWCDEILVIDDFSSDSSLEIARKNHASVFRRHLAGNFADQRNFGLSKAKGDWVLFVDADEVVSKELAKEIRKSVEIDCNGFFLKRQDWLFGKKLLYGETNRVRLLRLAKKDAGTWTRPVHEIWDVKGVVGTLENSLDHFPHPDVAQFVSSINMYSTENAKFLFHEKIRVPWWHIIAYPAGKFFMDYFWFSGFRDGTPGAIMAIAMSMHSFLTRAKLWLLWQKHETA